MLCLVNVSDKEDGAQSSLQLCEELSELCLYVLCGCHGAGDCSPWLHFSHYSVLSFHTFWLVVVVVVVVYDICWRDRL